MNISGLLIITDPSCTDSVVLSLLSFPGLEVHEQLPDGRVVAVLERESTKDEVKAVKQLHDIDGVISATMVYHNFEEEVEKLESI